MAIKRCLCLLLFLISLFVSVFSLAVAEDPKEKELIKISDKKAEWSIAKEGLQKIPIDFEDSDPTDYSIDANSDKSIIFYLDYDGVTVVPMAMGKTNLTIASRTDKKKKLIITVDVMKKAVMNLNAEKLKAFAFIDNSYLQLKDKPTLRYFVYGGEKPYKSIKLSFEKVISAFADDTGIPEGDISKKAFQKFKFKSVLGYEMIQPVLTVVDAKLKEYKATSNVAIVKNNISVMPEYIPYTVKPGEPIEIPYKIIGGSGNYNVAEYVEYVTADYSEIKDRKDKKSKGDGAIVLNPGVKGFDARMAVCVYDKKTKCSSQQKLDTIFLKLVY